MTDVPKNAVPDSVITFLVGIGFFFGMMIGTLIGSFGSSDMSDLGLRWMGEAIAEGIAEAACIESRGEWKSYGCEFKK